MLELPVDYRIDSCVYGRVQLRLQQVFYVWTLVTELSIPKAAVSDKPRSVHCQPVSAGHQSFRQQYQRIRHLNKAPAVGAPTVTHVGRLRLITIILLHCTCALTPAGNTKYNNWLIHELGTRHNYLHKAIILNSHHFVLTIMILL